MFSKFNIFIFIIVVEGCCFIIRFCVQVTCAFVVLEMTCVAYACFEVGFLYIYKTQVEGRRWCNLSSICQLKLVADSREFLNQDHSHFQMFLSFFVLLTFSLFGCFHYL